MTELEQDIDPYWNEDISVGEAVVQRQERPSECGFTPRRNDTLEVKPSTNLSTQRDTRLCDGQALYSGPRHHLNYRHLLATI